MASQPDGTALPSTVLDKAESLELHNRITGFSTKAAEALSDRIRQFALGGLAIVWLFQVSQPGEIDLPRRLAAALLWLAITLMLDFVHTTLAAISWWLLKRSMAGKTFIDIAVNPLPRLFEDVKLPNNHVSRRPKAHWPLLLIRSGTVALAFGLIAWYLYERIRLT